MQFESIQAALTMSGHGVYVWSAYAITAAILAGLCFAPVVRMRKIKAEIRRIQVRDSKLKNSP